METRNISLTLEKAKEWYNSGNEALKEAALQAYTKEELEFFDFTDIKTFWDAVEALGLNEDAIQYDLSKFEHLEVNISTHLTAIYKLDIIHKALNRGWNPSFVEGPVHYPCIRFYYAGEKVRDAISSNNNWVLGATFKSNGQKYTLVGGNYISYYSEGLANFDYEYGDVLSHLGLFGCKSEEIARHMSCYFSKEIFEVAYAQHIGTYEWV